MNILFASSEVVPFAKTGGLADVSGALPIEIKRQGHSVHVVMPAYDSVYRTENPPEAMGLSFEIPVGPQLVQGRLLRGHLPNSDVPVYFIEQPQYFRRAELYGENGTDYPDNCERFVFFCRAALECIRLLDLDIDLVHANDWQTGLIPALLKTEYSMSPTYRNIASLITIHNLAYQGIFWHHAMPLTGMNWAYFNWKQMEYHGHLNLLKTGIVFSDAINTVSPTYAVEIQTEELGCGLEDVLRHRNSVLSGILNGIDTSVWNPATDHHLTLNYDVQSWQLGKPPNKEQLQMELGLPPEPSVPLIGVIGRLAEQKGWSFIIKLMKQWAATEDIQWAILGTGQKEYETQLANLSKDHPHRISARLAFSDQLAHRIEAGADLFLMPSQYEPCGLNQMYSMAYGTIPVVRSTGGLADSVVDIDEAMADRSATGFKFGPFEFDAFQQAVCRAMNTYRHQPETWQQLVANGMASKFSWTESAKHYLNLYRQTIER